MSKSIFTKTACVFNLILCSFIQIITAQSFTEASPAPPFEGVRFSSIAFADVDVDGDQDVLITGWNRSLTPIAKMYTNDGKGNFHQVSETPFEGAVSSSIAFADIDGDKDPDVLITGGTKSDGRIAKLYRNDGRGNFSEVPNTPFEGVEISSVALADVDGDTDLDVLISGQNNAEKPMTKLYSNDGWGHFTEVPDTPFEDVMLSKVVFEDVDGDGDPDVLISGVVNLSDPSTKLYLNNGQGRFIYIPGTPFEEVLAFAMAFSDIDGDKDPDLLVYGMDGFPDSRALFVRLFINDGKGIFREKEGTSLPRLMAEAIAFADVDGDNDQDFIVAGSITAGRPAVKLYTNDGQGNFSEVAGMPFEQLENGSVAFSDVDGDGDQDVLITGECLTTDDLFHYSKLYINTGGNSKKD